MSDVAQEQAQATAPEDQTAVSTSDETGTPEEKEIPQVETKTFTQEELDRIVQKEKSRAENKAHREYVKKLEAMTANQQRQTEAPPAKTVDGKPKIADFQDVEAYVEAVADWKIEQKEAKASQARESEKEQARVVDINTKTEKIYSEAEKIPGFDREVFDELPLTEMIAKSIIESEVAPALMAYMSAHEDDVKRISSLSPTRQAIEIGKIEAKLAEKKVVKASNAPDPIKPVGSRGGEITKKIENMTMAELQEYERKRGARWVRR